MDNKKKGGGGRKDKLCGGDGECHGCGRRGQHVTKGTVSRAKHPISTVIWCDQGSLAALIRPIGKIAPIHEYDGVLWKSTRISESTIYLIKSQL
jgi:hypothetical protein